MIISHKYKFIYIKTSKTASTSIEIALSGILDEKSQDVATTLAPEDQEIRNKLGFLGPTNHKKHTSENRGLATSGRFNVRNLLDRQIWRPHTQLKELEMNKKIWNEIKEYEVVTSIRNPFDRLVSAYFWNQRKRPFPKLSLIGTGTFSHQIKGYIKDQLGGYDKNFQEFIFGNKKSLLEDVSLRGEIKVNSWIRFESLNYDLNKLTEKLKIDYDLSKVVTSIHAKNNFRKDSLPYQFFYLSNPGTREYVEKLCAKEIDMFSYQFMDSF